MKPTVEICRFRVVDEGKLVACGKAATHRVDTEWGSGKSLCPEHAEYTVGLGMKVITVEAAKERRRR